MTARKRSRPRKGRSRASAPVASPGEGDGVDPRVTFDHRVRRRSPRKQAQLASQAFEILCLAFADSVDPLLQQAELLDVKASPDGAALILHVRAPDDAEEASTLEAHLARASGYLRTAVGAGVTRRRLPMIQFVLA